ncbi:hypothetical protein GDO81_002784 [Engystomops pustulosus]|uniref:Uncharacterized protein n=1 Tax=Engystomops pustulosus TaxID=76066 RepID=A0AAV7DPK7_ENGPU|nr:hypothetical protein GDO81_002784 [Engystomops pustulosus]
MSPSSRKLLRMRYCHLFPPDNSGLYCAASCFSAEEVQESPGAGWCHRISGTAEWEKPCIIRRRQTAGPPCRTLFDVCSYNSALFTKMGQNYTSSP